MSARLGRLCVAAFALLAATAYAGRDPLAEGLRHCALMSDEPQRLACFDALAAALPKIKTDQFGLTGAIAHQREPSTPVVAVQESLQGRITGLRAGAGGNAIFTLDNGQQWIEIQARPGVQFSVGESVQIEYGSMGSLWLKADRHRQTKVKRIQ